MLLIKRKSDVLGAFSSSLCLIHCVFTPLLFIAQAGSASCCGTPPIWWKFIDFLFLGLSFFAVLWTVKKSTINWIKPILWLNWGILFALIVNEKLELFPVIEAMVYIPTITLIILHLYNRKHSKCTNDKCCVNEG